MTRSEEIAAALERWERIPKYPDLYAEEKTEAGDELARLLRESQPEPNPPTNSESSTEAADWWCPFCGQAVPGSNVTYHETHDTRCGGCGNRVMVERPQTEPAPVGGDDEALLNVLDAIETKLASTEQYELAIGCQSVATRLRAALSDLARLEARPSRYEDLMAIEQLQVQVDHYRTGMTEARAALAAAVAEGDQFCRTLVDLYDAADETGQPWRRISVSNALIDGLRARAGRNDG